MYAVLLEGWDRERDTSSFGLIYMPSVSTSMRTLDFHNALLGWKDELEQVAPIALFYRGFRESRFLLPESSGVHRFSNSSASMHSK
jgi:hypothetical protein